MGLVAEVVRYFSRCHVRSKTRSQGLTYNKSCLISPSLYSWIHALNSSPGFIITFQRVQGTFWRYLEVMGYLCEFRNKQVIAQLSLNRNSCAIFAGLMKFRFLSLLISLDWTVAACWIRLYQVEFLQFYPCYTNMIPKRFDLENAVTLYLLFSRKMLDW